MEFGWGQVLTIVGANIILIMGMLATYVTLYLHNDKKIESNRKETNEILKAISEEMKDFHSRLLIIEERNKPKIL